MSIGYIGVLAVCQLVTLHAWSADCLSIGYIGVLSTCQSVTFEC